MVCDEGVLLKFDARIGKGIKLHLSNGHNKAGFISTDCLRKEIKFSEHVFLNYSEMMAHV